MSTFYTYQVWQTFLHFVKFEINKIKKSLYRHSSNYVLTDMKYFARQMPQKIRLFVKSMMRQEL